jgi:uncharacterized protein
MKLEQSFTVAAPPDVVFAALTDVARVAPHLPGAQIDEASGDGTYTGQFKVKLGPTTANYTGALKMETVDETARTATMHAKGTDKRGQGGATASIVSAVHEDGTGSRVEVVTDFTITGRLARFGRSGMIEDISNKLLQNFAESLQADLAAGHAATEAAAEASGPEPADRPADGAASAPPPPPANEPLDSNALVLGMLKDRLAANPLPVLGLVLALLVLVRRARR